eukprot:gb/GECH01011601.1/.p1 GENE.gb/GECH01011601.1/~~gb/GECH01011601.1/.p1  ORF type:complete len:168 (+),score=49.74 gb/GECH01011601.1/:1-504(+)
MANVREVTVFHPMMYWAQREDAIYLTLDVPDSSDVDIDLKPEKMHFKGVGGSERKQYECEIEFFDEINKEESKYRVGARNIFFHLAKKENKWWDRLLKQKGKNNFLHVDWNKWKDEDESDEEAGGFNLGDLPMESFGAGSDDEDDDEPVEEEDKGNLEDVDQSKQDQ